MRNNLVKVIAILYLLSEHRRLGRYQISKILKLGEGVVRRTLEELKKGGFVISLRGGSSLTLKGKELLKRLLKEFRIKKVTRVDVTEIVGQGYLGVGVCYKTSLHNILRIRDEVVRGGAEGALILTFERGKLKMPYINSEEFSRVDEFIRNVAKAFELSEGDIIIIGFDKEFGKALMGVLRAVFLLYK